MTGFSRIIDRWKSSQGSADDLRNMLIEAGWTPPIEKPERLDVPIEKMRSRERHHDRIARADDDYASQAGDRHEEEIFRNKARGRRAKAAKYEYAADLLEVLRQAGLRARS
ncbi:MAG TPA: hypothetical protein VFT30_03040 [Nitrospira sp.]|nr:hypothetical protein [Nitrospira sp.]